MATTLRQLLGGLNDRASADPGAATIEDVTGALAHLGRALSGLADDGLTARDSTRQRTVTALATACTTAGLLWPHHGGPLTDLAGAAADLAGRDRAIMGRSHRWALAVEVAETADTCARFGRRLLPRTAAPELAAVRALAATLEQDAQADPPTATGWGLLDRPVPLTATPRGPSEMTALDAAAALTAALDRAQGGNDLTLRDFRAAVAAAEITCRRAATFDAAVAGDDAGPLVVAGLAWHQAGRASTVFDDGRRAGPVDPRGVVAWARSLAGALHTNIDRLSALPAHGDDHGDDHDVRHTDGMAQQVAGQLPTLADRLLAAVDHWSRTGRLYASARDLPPMENMPEDRIEAVIAGRHVLATGADLDRLRQAVGRAADLSTGLVETLYRPGTGEQEQRHLPDRPDREALLRGVTGRLLRVQAVERDIAAIRSRHQPAPHPPPR
ncbi:hypothetical protein E4P40_10435 [Blastococcus sp. CT_GayMR20]|uniref:hypothetical protein n=1 Tax=Blastococcus sp. CT_GayMR20 TaxID=2559609 RepID=UPI0010741F44|nr:hypothetical protein [Blastococcus sp. CT_GayMR20]TFV88116.1 hypothetical protein E4P40_10435 [Blastococcus sp. CT_GayMR20]